MKVKYIGKKTTIRDSFKEYAEKKLLKLEKFFNDDATATIIVTNDDQDETVEITIKYNGMFFRAEKTSTDRTISLDLVMDILAKQIRRNKERLEKRFKTAISTDFYEKPSSDISESKTLVKTKKFYVGMMDAEEAILQMNMLDHEFFMFRNPQDGEINVVYRRKDGNYGLLEPVDKD